VHLPNSQRLQNALLWKSFQTLCSLSSSVCFKIKTYPYTSRNNLSNIFYLFEYLIFLEITFNLNYLQKLDHDNDTVTNFGFVIYVWNLKRTNVSIVILVQTYRRLMSMDTHNRSGVYTCMIPSSQVSTLFFFKIKCTQSNIHSYTSYKQVMI